MSVYAGPEISTDGLVLALDAANPKSILSSVEVLVVAGGGGGGAYAAGAGGGGGGVIYNSNYDITSLNASVTVTVGDGGAGGKYSPYTASKNGNNSIFGTLTAIGGGAAGMGWAQNPGSTGGSGGGGAGYDGNANTTATVAGGSGTRLQGYAGGLGRGISTNRGAGGGGGGGGGVGGDSTTNSGGNGGIGFLSSISGTATYYAGGGGGGDYGSANGGTGGQGGGGNVSGGNSSNQPAGNGGTNTGGGGGGSRSATSDSWDGGNGGSGVVIVRYPGSQKATGGVITSVGGNTIHTFNSSGTFTANLLQDIVGSNYNGTLTNGPTYSSANGGYIVFDGTNDYVNIDGSSVADFGPTTDAFTIEVVYRSFSSSSRTISSALYDRYRYYFYHNYTNNTAFFSYVKKEWETTSNFVVHSNTITGLNSKGSWNHVTMTYTKNGENGTLSGYGNGVLVGSTTDSRMSSYPLGSHFIGNSNHAGFGNYSFDGAVSIVKVYNRALTSTEVLRSFNALRGRYGI